MSGFGGGAGHSGGDPGNNNRENSRKHRGKEHGPERDEGKGKEERSHKKDASEKFPVCFGCGVKGHKRAECPNKVASIKKEGKPKCRTLQGKVGTNPCTMTLDSGADHTVVRADLVAEADYTGRSSRVETIMGAGGTCQQLKCGLRLGRSTCLSMKCLWCPKTVRMKYC